MNSIHESHTTEKVERFCSFIQIKTNALSRICILGFKITDSHIFDGEDIIFSISREDRNFFNSI